jgi:hypothetical protein
MDPALAELISDVAVIAGGVVTGVLVANLVAGRTRDLEREKRRLDLIAVFLRDVETLRDQGKLQAMGQPIVDFREAQDRGYSSLTQLRIIAPSLAKAALELWAAAQQILAATQLRMHAAGREIPQDALDWKKLDKEFEDSHRAFLEAATRSFR